MDKVELVQKFVSRLVDSYGYSAEQMSTNFVAENGATIDIAIWRDAQSCKERKMPDVCVAIVCTSDCERIEAKDYFKNLMSVPMYHFFVATDLNKTMLFYHNNLRPDSMVQISDFPKPDDCADEGKLEKFIKKELDANKDALFNAFTRCHNIIRNNDKLSPETAFDEICKVLFIKMRYECSNPDGELLYSASKFERDDEESHDPDYINTLYREVIWDYHTVRLFEPQDRIRIKRQSFVMILKELEVTNFNYTDVDVRGVAFETFLGKTFRGELGQYYTPRSVVNYMIEVLDPKEGDKICDPCCGSGGFLIKTFEYIREKIEKDVNAQIKAVQTSNLSKAEKKKQIEELIGELDKHREGSRMWKLCNEYLYGSETNPRMARTSKINMIMHGDGQVEICQHDGLTDVPGAIEEGKYDMVLVNPPYGVRIDRNYVDENSNQRLDKLYELKQTAVEALFVERTLKLLRPGGVAGLVLPDSIMSAMVYESVRNFVEKEAEILNITSIPADVFLASGANMKPSVLFLRRNAGGFAENSTLSVAKVYEAGINPTGQPTENAQLEECAQLVKRWIEGMKIEDGDYVKVVSRRDLDRWNITPIFQEPKMKYHSRYTYVPLKEILTPSKEYVRIEEGKEYSRVTVKLSNKGLSERDRLIGSKIGTKRQKLVHSGQFVISKIDGKSGAFGFVPKELEGAIVTPDFIVYDVDTKCVYPEYLELVLSSPAILDQYKAESFGSTGRKRIQQVTFVRTLIPLPSLQEQQAMVEDIVALRQKQREVEEHLSEAVNEFRNKLF